jgi:single-strand DNA-binding protein
MADINHVVLVGRLTRDIEIAYSKNNNTPIGKLSLALNRRRKNGDQWVEEANFFDVTIIGNTAESLKQYLLKGKQIGVEGSLQQDRWEKDGQKFSKVIVMANNIQLLGGGAGNGGSNASQGYTPRQNSTSRPAAPAANYEPTPDEGQSFGGDEGSGSFPEDIPF